MCVYDRSGRGWSEPAPGPRDGLAVARELHTLLERGYLKETEGNISARISGQNAFAITPSNFDYMKMTPDDIRGKVFASSPIL